jgi:hypothetical protein
MIFQCTIRVAMVSAPRRTFEPIPIAMAALVTLSLPLPLRWSTLGAAAFAFAVLVVIALRRTRSSELGTAAALALAGVGVVVLGYAAYALVHAGVFGPVGRLGYPFLVATGLRLEGGAWLVMLTGLVGVAPLVFEKSG